LRVRSKKEREPEERAAGSFCFSLLFFEIFAYRQFSAVSSSLLPIRRVKGPEVIRDIALHVKKEEEREGKERGRDAGKRERERERFRPPSSPPSICLLRHLERETFPLFFLHRISPTYLGTERRTDGRSRVGLARGQSELDVAGD
jgi:hypothetical protein